MRAQPRAQARQSRTVAGARGPRSGGRVSREAGASGSCLGGSWEGRGNAVGLGRPWPPLTGGDCRRQPGACNTTCQRQHRLRPTRASPPPIHSSRPLPQSAPRNPTKRTVPRAQSPPCTPIACICHVCASGRGAPAHTLPDRPATRTSRGEGEKPARSPALKPRPAPRGRACRPGRKAWCAASGRRPQRHPPTRGCQRRRPPRRRQRQRSLRRHRPARRLHPEG